MLGGAPVLRGTRMPVDAIVDNLDDGVNIAEIAEQFEIPPDRIDGDSDLRQESPHSASSIAFVVLGSNIWPVVRDHGAAIAAKVDAATPGSYEFIEMPPPPKRHTDSG